MSLNSLALEIVQGTLVDLGYSGTARKLLEEIEEKKKRLPERFIDGQAPSDSSIDPEVAAVLIATSPSHPFATWLFLELEKGPPYSLAIERLEEIIDGTQNVTQGNAAGSSSSSTNGASARADSPSTSEAMLILYLIKRTLFLQSVVGISYSHGLDGASAAGGGAADPNGSGGATGSDSSVEHLITFLTYDSMPLLDRINATDRSVISQLLPHSEGLAYQLNREKESATLLPLLTNSPIKPNYLSRTVFHHSTLYALTPTPRRDDIVVRPTYETDVALLNAVLIRKYLGRYFVNSGSSISNSATIGAESSSSAMALDYDSEPIPKRTSLVAYPSSSASTSAGYPVPSSGSSIGSGYIFQLLASASAYHKLRSPYYLPSRTAPEDPSILIPPFPVNNHYRAQFPTQLIHTFRDHNDEVWFARFSPSGKYLMTGSRDGELCLYSAILPGFPLLQRLVSNDQTDNEAFVGPFKFVKRSGPEPSCQGVVYGCWDEEDRYFVSCGMDTMVRVWDVSATTAHYSKEVNLTTVSNFGSNSNSNSKAPSSSSNSASKRITRSMDVDSESRPFKLLSCFTIGENLRVRSCSFIPGKSNGTDNPVFVIGSPDKTLKIYDIHGTELFDFFCDTTDSDESEDLIKIENEELSEKKGAGATGATTTGVAPSAAITTTTSAASSSSPPTQAPSSSPVTPALPSGAPSRFLQKNFNRVVDFDITSDGKYLISGNDDKSVYIYTIPDLADDTSKAVKVCSLNLKGKSNFIKVSANGKQFLVNVAQELQLWDISDLATTGKPILVRKFRGHRVDDNVIRAGFGYLNTSAIGETMGGRICPEELILSGSADGYIYIWKLATGQLIKRIKGHVGVCSCVDWNRFYIPDSVAGSSITTGVPNKGSSSIGIQSGSASRSSNRDYGKLWCSVGDDRQTKIYGPPDWAQW